MQSSYIVPSQLLIGYLDGKHRKIGQAISTNQFSRELTSQQYQLHHSSNSTSRLLAEDSSKRQEVVNSAEDDRKEANAKAKKEAYFANVALLEKVLAQLKLSAEARKALKSAEDCDGRISVKSLSRILGEYQPEPGSVSDAAIPSQDVRNLLSSLEFENASGNSGAATLEGLKQQGSYSFDEFRKVIDDLDCQSSTAGAKGGRGKTNGSGSSTSSAAGGTVTSAGATSANLDCPPSSAIPPFARHDTAGTPDGKATPREVQAENAKEREKASGEDAPDANQPVENADSSDEVNKSALAEGSAQPFEGADRQDESVGSTHRVSSDESQSTGAVSGSQADCSATSPDSLSFLAQMSAGMVSSISPEETSQAPESNDDIMNGLNQQTALAGIGADGNAAGRASGERKASPVFAAADTGGASGSTPVDTSITPPAQTGRNSMQSGDQGGGSSQTASSNSGLNSPNGNTEQFLWSATQTAQNGTSDSSSGQGVSANNLAGSALLQEEIAKNGFVTGEIRLSETGESTDSAVSSTASRLSKEMDLTLSKDLGASSLSEASDKASIKSNKSKEVFLASMEDDRPSPTSSSSSDAAELRADDGLSSLTTSKSDGASSTVSTGSSKGQLNTSASSWTSELAERIQNLYQQKRTSNLTLDLEPEGMGHLTLRVSTRKQEVTAFISTDTQQAGELLSRNSNLLRSNMESLGLTLTNLFVDVRQGKNGNSSSFFRNGKSEERKTASVSAIQDKSVQKNPANSNLTGANSERLINLVA